MNFRSPATHTMSPWVRNTFLTVLPKLLLMRRPHYSPRYFKFYWNRSIASKYYSTYLIPKWASNLEIKDLYAKIMTKLHHKKWLDTSLNCNNFYKSESMVHLIVSCIVWMKELLDSMFYDPKTKIFWHIFWIKSLSCLLWYWRSLNGFFFHHIIWNIKWNLNLNWLIKQWKCCPNRRFTNKPHALPVGILQSLQKNPSLNLQHILTIIQNLHSKSMIIQYFISRFS